jgi:hypothetical protein
LATFYQEVVESFNNNDFTAQEKTIAEPQLIQPLKAFLLSLDNEFQTDHFFQQIKNKNARVVAATIVRHKQNYVLEILLADESNKAQKNKEVRIYDKNNLLLAKANTDRYGQIQFKLGEDSYRIETRGKSEDIELCNNRMITIILPKKTHWWQ